MTDQEQIKRFREGFPQLNIESAATVGHGIVRYSEEQAAEAASYADSASVDGKCKFVPASGAASRMFKDIFARKPEAVKKLASNLEQFAFYTPEVFGEAPFDPERTATLLLEEEGLGYGFKPKGVLKFHRYAGEVRTALAEHLVEGQAYMRSQDGSTVSLVVTISPEHRSLFEKALEEVKPEYEKRYGVRYDVTFVYQDKATDTLAVTPDNRPFLDENGNVLRRPAGHGALIYNLDKLDTELVSIKNIDNVSVESHLGVTAFWKKVLMGRALLLRDVAREYQAEMDAVESLQPMKVYTPFPGVTNNPPDIYATEECQALCQEIEGWLATEFCIEMPVAHDCRARFEALRKKLDRPLRVCGMVRNEGEPGGGPFVIREKDGSTSLQILESVQIGDSTLMAQSTHFNPVDLVCCLKDRHGKKYRLTEHVDPDTGFISSKSYQGRELKALELPGLWNGAMSDWLTSFVEVPVETFNPVKVVLDLLKPAHQK